VHFACAAAAAQLAAQPAIVTADASELEVRNEFHMAVEAVAHFVGIEGEFVGHPLWRLVLRHGQQQQVVRIRIVRHVDGQ
jgi:hypothetical protein